MFDGRNLLELPGDKMRGLRGNRISMIFQQPQSSLNPVYDVGRQLGEVLELHKGMRKKTARTRSAELLRMVGIPDPERRLEAYPFSLSGGMAQRVMIAMALACEPELLIADEPTTALDVTIQAQILDLMRALQADTGTAIILITHDLGVVAGTVDRVVVMYAGQVVEAAPTQDLFARPAHPYTEGLMASVPRLDAPRARLHAIPGQVPAATAWPSGCRFHPRCPYAWDKCRTEEPPLLEAGTPAHTARCWLVAEPARRVAGP